MNDFFRTIRGAQLADTIIRQLPRLVDELKRLNDLKQQELNKQGEHKNDE